MKFFYQEINRYRFAFNGKEKDSEVKGEGNQYDYGMRIYDPRLGKFLSVDPLTRNFAFYTPYQFAGDRPIVAIDLDGEEDLWIHLKKQNDGSFLEVSRDENLSASKQIELQQKLGRLAPSDGTVYTCDDDDGNTQIVAYYPTVVIESTKLKPHFDFVNFVERRMIGNYPNDLEGSADPSLSGGNSLADAHGALNFSSNSLKVMGLGLAFIDPPVGIALFSYASKIDMIDTGVEMKQDYNAGNYTSVGVRGAATIIGEVAFHKIDAIPGLSAQRKLATNAAAHLIINKAKDHIISNEKK